MKIQNIDVFAFRVEGEHRADPWFDYRKYAENSDDYDRRTSTVLLTRITCDDGSEGFAFGGSAELAARAKEMLAGEDPFDHEGANRKMNHPRGLGWGSATIDMAMWDLCGRITQQPVHKLLGGRRERIKCYASSLFNVGSPSDYADHAEACIRRGYKGYKIHPFVNRDPQTFELLRAPGAFPMHDINVCCEIRDRLGESVPLMHDPYGAYNFEQAVHVGKTLEELKFAWFEHPMQENRIDLYQRLRQMIRVPLCGPETVGGGPFSRVEWILRGATDITRIDVHHGGITGCWKLLNFCMLQQVRCELHLGGAAELQLAAAAGEDIVEYFERFVIDPDKVLGEPAPYLKSPWLRIEDGWAIIPQTAGLGFELDWDYIKRHKV